MNEESPTSSNNLLELHTCATVEAVDDGHGIFGELYHAEKVWEALWDGGDGVGDGSSPAAAALSDGVGVVGDGDLNVGTPTGTILCSQDLPATTYLNSKMETVTPHEIPIEIHNTTSHYKVRVRWIDLQGHNSPTTHLWDVLPSSTFEQYSKPGHLFILSIVSATNVYEEDEHMLGAYRPKRGLPSSTPHCIIVQGGGDSDSIDTPFLLETLLLDESKFDTFSVAASDLENYNARNHSRQTAEKTVQMLQTIVKNAIQHPDEEKYHKLRLSNRKIQHYIVSSWGSVEILKTLGFVEKQLQVDGGNKDDQETFLVLPTPIRENTKRIGKKALEILTLLHSRLLPEFITDLAPPTPWQNVGVYTGGKSGGNWNNNRGFISDDEKWARAERISGLRRSGRARKPAPGEAPSSRGRWGR